MALCDGLSVLARKASSIKLVFMRWTCNWQDALQANKNGGEAVAVL